MDISVRTLVFMSVWYTGFWFALLAKLLVLDNLHGCNRMWLVWEFQPVALEMGYCKISTAQMPTLSPCQVRLTILQIDQNHSHDDFVVQGCASGGHVCEVELHVLHWKSWLQMKKRHKAAWRMSKVNFNHMPGHWKNKASAHDWC